MDLRGLIGRGREHQGGEGPVVDPRELAKLRVGGLLFAVLPRSDPRRPERDVLWLGRELLRDLRLREVRASPCPREHGGSDVDLEGGNHERSLADVQAGGERAAAVGAQASLSRIGRA